MNSTRDVTPPVPWAVPVPDHPFSEGISLISNLNLPKPALTSDHSLLSHSLLSGMFSLALRKVFFAVLKISRSRPRPQIQLLRFLRKCVTKASGFFTHCTRCPVLMESVFSTALILLKWLNLAAGRLFVLKDFLFFFLLSTPPCCVGSWYKIEHDCFIVV